MGNLAITAQEQAWARNQLARMWDESGTGADMSALAEEAYEAQQVSEARDIVAGLSDLPPTVEHLRIVLNWLDGNQESARQMGLPF